MRRADLLLDEHVSPLRAAHTETGRTRLRSVLTTAIVIAVSLVLGGLTSPGQMLPLGLGSLSNSASGYTLLTAATIWFVGERRTLPAAMQGVGSFLALLIGYQIVSTLRGFPDSEEFFTLIAVVVGPFVGIATAWLHARGTRAAASVAILAGIALGDSSDGLLRVLATTGWLYWTLVGAAGLALLVVVVKTRLTSMRDRSIAVAGAALLAGAYVAAFAVLS